MRFRRSQHRTDGNQGEIQKAVEGIGKSFASTTAVGDGFPDAVVGGVMTITAKCDCGAKSEMKIPYNWLLEIKNPDGKGTKLTPDEEKFAGRWKGQQNKVASVAEALAVVGVEK